MSGTREERRAALEYGRYGREVAREVAREGCGHLVSYVDPRGGPEGLRLLADEVVTPLRDGFGAWRPVLGAAPQARAHATIVTPHR